MSVPDTVMGGATGEFQRRRGLILDMQQEGDSTTIEAKVPVAEMLVICRLTGPRMRKLCSDERSLTTNV